MSCTIFFPVLQVVEQVSMLDSVWEMLQEQPITTRHNLTRELLDWAVCTRQSRAFGVPQPKGEACLHSAGPAACRGWRPEAAGLQQLQ